LKLFNNNTIIKYLMLVCQTCKNNGVYYVSDEQNHLVKCDYCGKKFCNFHMNRHRCVSDLI